MASDAYEAYGLKFPADIPAEEMDRSIGITLSMHNSHLPITLIPVSAELYLKNGNVVPISWSNYAIRGEGDEDVLEMHDVLFDGWAVTFLAAYLSLQAAEMFQIDVSSEESAGGQMVTGDLQQSFDPYDVTFSSNGFVANLDQMLPVMGLLI